MSRLRTIASTVVSGYLLALVSVLSNIFVTPLMLRSVGSTSYGIQIAVQSLVTYISLAEFGVGVAMLPHAARTLAAKDYAGLNRLVSTAFFYLLGISLLIFGVCFLLRDGVGEVIKASVESRDLASTLFMLFVVNACLGLLSSIFGALAIALDLLATQNKIALASALVSLLGSVAIFQSGGGLVAAALLVTGVSFVNLLVLANLVKRNGTWLSLRPAHVSVETFRRLLPTGTFAFLLQLNSIIAFTADNLIVGATLGPAMVGEYSLTYRFVEFGMRLQMILTKAIHPTFVALQREGLEDALTTFHRQAVKCLGATAALFAVFYVLFADQVLFVWLGTHMVTDTKLVVLLSVFSALVCASGPTFFLLIVKDKIRFLGILGFSTSLLNIAVSLLAIPILGVSGTALGTVLATVVNLIFIAALCRRGDLVGRGGFVQETLVPLGRALLIFIVAAAFIRWGFGVAWSGTEDRLATGGALAVAALALSLVWLGVFGRWSTSAAERALILGKARAALSSKRRSGMRG